jgi:hypothetical protein
MGDTENFAACWGQIIDIQLWVLVEYFCGQNDFHYVQGIRISGHGSNLNYSSCN